MKIELLPQREDWEFWKNKLFSQILTTSIVLCLVILEIFNEKASKGIIIFWLILNLITAGQIILQDKRKVRESMKNGNNK